MLSGGVEGEGEGSRGVGAEKKIQFQRNIYFLRAFLVVPSRKHEGAEVRRENRLNQK